MITVVQVFSGVSVTTTQTLTSAAYNSEILGRVCGFFYDLADSSTGTYVSVTARMIAAADSAASFVAPIDTAGAAMNVLGQINSNDRYIAYRYDELPAVPWTQVQLISVTNQTITFRAVYMVYNDDLHG